MRNDFSSAKLVRLLGQWTPMEADAGGMDFAERMGLWVNAFDAIDLQASLQAIKAIETAAAGGAKGVRPIRADALDDDVRRVRGALAHAIAQPLVPLHGATEGTYAPYHQRHLELQRQMDQMIRPLREHVRQAIARVSVRLHQLAALDAALDQVIAPREQTILPTAATLMRRRFEHLKKANEPLEAFEQDWRQALLAELDLRLETVWGLVEALHEELTH
ncbi:MAG TPA: DUF3348 family protein [Ramlibacter sp.]|nr:DUF3348 family protein [Ramlibacter sp.]